MMPSPARWAGNLPLCVSGKAYVHPGLRYQEKMITGSIKELLFGWRQNLIGNVRTGCFQSQIS